jgi:hypothetical protein
MDMGRELRPSAATPHRVGPSVDGRGKDWVDNVIAHSGKQSGSPSCSKRATVIRMGEEFNMAEDTKVYPTGLTEKEAMEINEGLKWGTRIFGGIAVLAHVLAFALTPWLH